MTIACRPVTSFHSVDRERMRSEVRLVRLPAPPGISYPWAREGFFRRREDAVRCNRLLVAYTTDKNGRIVRGWYLTSDDRHIKSPYRYGDCPRKAAWLDTLAIRKESEPALKYLNAQRQQNAQNLSIVPAVPVPMTSQTTEPASKLTASQLRWTNLAISRQVSELICDSVPTWRHFEPITHKAELERRERCYEWAKDLVGAARVMGLRDDDISLWLEQSELVIAAARIAGLPDNPPGEQDATDTNDCE